MSFEQLLDQALFAESEIKTSTIGGHKIKEHPGRLSKALGKPAFDANEGELNSYVDNAQGHKLHESLDPAALRQVLSHLLRASNLLTQSGRDEEAAAIEAIYDKLQAEYQGTEQHSTLLDREVGRPISRT